MHPTDANSRALQGASKVRVWNSRGEVILPLHITDAIRPCVVSSEKGAWLATTVTGQTIRLSFRQMIELILRRERASTTRE